MAGAAEMLIWAEQGAERNWKEVLVVGASLFVGDTIQPTATSGLT